MIRYKGSQSLLLCLLILCQTLFVWFEVFWKGIKPYVGVVCKVGGFIDGRHTAGSSAGALSLFHGWQWSSCCYHIQTRNNDHEHTKPNKRLVGCMNYIHSRYEETLEVNFWEKTPVYHCDTNVYSILGVMYRTECKVEYTFPCKHQYIPVLSRQRQMRVMQVNTPSPCSHQPR